MTQARPGYAIFVTIQKIKDGTKTISHVLLVILCGNMMLYLFYYVVNKVIESCRKAKKGKKIGDDKPLETSDNESQCQKPNPFKSYPGPFFAIIALMLGFFAIDAYLARSANRNLTAAESRNLNADCNFLGFYGK